MDGVEPPTQGFSVLKSMVLFGLMWCYMVVLPIFLSISVQVSRYKTTKCFRYVLVKKELSNFDSLDYIKIRECLVYFQAKYRFY